jgi:hypothetical protein
VISCSVARIQSLPSLEERSECRQLDGGDLLPQRRERTSATTFGDSPG